MFKRIRFENLMSLLSLDIECKDMNLIDNFDLLGGKYIDFKLCIYLIMVFLYKVLYLMNFNIF